VLHVNVLRTLSAFKGLQGGMGAGTGSDGSPAVPRAGLGALCSTEVETLKYYDLLLAQASRNNRAPAAPHPRGRGTGGRWGCRSGAQMCGLLRAQVDRAVELTVQHVKKLREMSPLWEMVQVVILICHCAYIWLREDVCLPLLRLVRDVHQALTALDFCLPQEGVDIKSIQVFILPVINIRPVVNTIWTVALPYFHMFISVGHLLAACRSLRSATACH